jgi:hypothetical protein
MVGHAGLWQTSRDSPTPSAAPDPSKKASCGLDMHALDHFPLKSLRSARKGIDQPFGARKFAI